MLDKTLNEGSTGRQALELFSKKWVIMVIHALFRGTQRLSDLRRALDGVSEKMLIQTLRELEAAGLVHREVRSAVPAHVDYSLTPLGETLRDPITRMCEWGREHMPAVSRSRERSGSD